MLFNSFEFLIFFPIVTIIYFIMPLKLRVYWLLAASYFFYMSWHPKYLLLILASTVITYLSGLMINKNKEKSKIKKIILAFCVISNLGILFFFKYFNWLVESLNILSHKFGGSDIASNLNILLPVGISFYTFQALSYSIDVYRGTIEVERNFFRYALFVSFFPQLVAGPIERSGNLLGQIKKMSKERMFSYENIANGLIVMTYGLFLKMVIADRIAILVNTVFNSYTSYGTVELAVAAIGFAIQIYCDFVSYSIIAIGAAQVMGVTLMSNFEMPYFAESIKDFWRRWHISLSTWFRDYLYIPLGGNRCSNLRKNFNLMITFLISGLWHGANWTYIFWGGLHGAYQVIGNMTGKIREKLNDKLNVNTKCWSWKFGKVLVTFFWVTLAWIFFRSTSIGNAFEYIERMFTKTNFWVLFDGSLYQLGLPQQEWDILIWAILTLIIVDAVQYVTKKRIDLVLSEQNLWFRWLVVIGMISVIFVCGKYGPNVAAEEFIYFQF